MLIGLMSDSHDDSAAVRRAVELFNRERVGLVLHAGDISSPGTATALAGLKASFIAVCGNNDRDWAGLREAFAPWGMVYHGYYDAVFDGKRLALMHELRLLHQLPPRKKYDVVVYGHTHHFDVRQGAAMLVNPGQCNLHLDGEATAALLDLGTMEVRKVRLVGVVSRQ